MLAAYPSARLPILGLSGLLHLVRHQSADVPLSHLAARCARGSPHRRQCPARQHFAEDGRLRLPALFAAHHSRRDAPLHPLHSLALGRRHHLRRPDRAGADGPEKARRLFQRRAHGLCHPGHFRLEPPGPQRRLAGNDQSRRNHRGAVHCGWHHLRAPAHPRAWRRRGHRQSHADLRVVRRRLRAFLPRVPRHEQLHRRIPCHERRIPAFPNQPGLPGYDDLRRARRGARRRLHAPNAAKGGLRRHPQSRLSRPQGPGTA